jgi:hypothetical protein
MTKSEIIENVDKFLTPYEWILLSDNDTVSMVGPGVLPEYFKNLQDMAINYHCWDYDPKFANNSQYSVNDVIFDNVTLPGLIVNFNAQKMYPIGRLFKSEMILIGSDAAHNGDCNIITSCEQLIEQNNLHTVYGRAIADHYGFERYNHRLYMVWGRND